MSERRVLRIEVSSPEAALDDFARAWDALADGAKLSPVEALGFESLSGLLNSLTPERWELIDWIRRHGPTPVPSNAIPISQEEPRSRSRHRGPNCARHLRAGRRGKPERPLGKRSTCGAPLVA